MTASAPRPQRLRIESAEQPGSILKGILLALPFVLVGLFMRGRVPPEDAWFPWVFIAAGAGWILFYLRMGYGRYKFGAAYLEVDMPALLGQKMSARLVIPGSVSARLLTADLTCRHVHWQHVRGEEGRRDGDSRSLTEKVLWSKVARFPILKRDGASEGQISFELPADQPVTDQPAGPDDQFRPGHYWELKIDIPAPGVDFERRFRFPVTKP